MLIPRRRSASSPRRRRPRSDDDDFYYEEERPLMQGWTVFEDDEPSHQMSPILAPNGDNIIYELEPIKQGFIGFIDPLYLEELGSPDAEAE